MTRALAAFALAGCTFTPGATGLKPGQVAIIDDTAMAFSAGTLGDITVDPLGFLAPDAFALGGLHARGFPVAVVTGATTFSDLTPQVLGPQSGERYSEMPVTNWQTDRPYGLGITAAHVDSFTVVYDGELYLPSGATTLQLAANGNGFIDLTLPAISPTLHAAYSDPTPATLTVTVDDAGWYPIRGAVSDTNAVALFQLSTVVSGVATLVTTDQLRARITAAPGTVVVGSGDRMLATLEAGSSIQSSLAALDWSNVVPTYDLLNIGATAYSLRFGGQLRVDTAEPYTFTVDYGNDTGDYVRLFVDGALVAGHWPGGIEQLVATAMPLTPGWHDLVLDYAQNTGTAKLGLTMSTPSFPAAPIPADRLRPVRTSGLLAAGTGTDTQLTDASASAPSVAAIPITVTVPTDAAVDLIDFFFDATGTGRGDLSVALSENATTDVFALPAMPAYENIWDYWPDRTAFAGVGVTAPFQATFTDSVMNGQASRITVPTVVASYHGGPNPPFAQTMIYTSAVDPTPGAVSIDAITVTADLQGAMLLIEVSTDGHTWITVANGGAPMVDAGDSVQYRLTITNDGWQYPTIPKVEIDYTTPAP